MKPPIFFFFCIYLHTPNRRINLAKQSLGLFLLCQTRDDGVSAVSNHDFLVMVGLKVIKKERRFGVQPILFLREKMGQFNSTVHE